MGRAWLREIPHTFSNALIGPGGRPPNVDLARQQHDEYRRRLSDSGLHVTTLAPDVDHPDCVFIEDTAVLIGEQLLITQPGAPERRGETGPVREALSAHFPITTMTGHATLDGGDVMIIGGTVYVGRSERTNEAGVEHLARLAAESGMDCVPVPVDGVLHLKSAVLPVSPDTVVVTPGAVDTSLLEGLRILEEDPGERHQFSALVLDDRVLITSAAPRTGEMVESLGIRIDPIDISEILAADGGLTCMSIISA